MPVTNIYCDSPLEIIDDTGAVTSFAVIGGGGQNTVQRGTHYASIFSGQRNSVGGSCSSILGGANNSDGSNPFTGMYGNGLTASVAPGTIGTPSIFWVDELVVANIVVDTTGVLYPSLPPGALYTNCALGTGYLQSPVYVA